LQGRARTLPKIRLNQRNFFTSGKGGGRRKDEKGRGRGSERKFVVCLQLIGGERGGRPELKKWPRILTKNRRRNSQKQLIQNLKRAGRGKRNNKKVSTHGTRWIRATERMGKPRPFFPASFDVLPGKPPKTRKYKREQKDNSWVGACLLQITGVDAGAKKRFQARLGRGRLKNLPALEGARSARTDVFNTFAQKSEMPIRGRSGKQNWCTYYTE